jgi:hypothetical protein
MVTAGILLASCDAGQLTDNWDGFADVRVSVTGEVRSATAGTPVTGARVFMPNGFQEEIETFTDAEGQYVLDGIVEECYLPIIHAEAAGFSSVEGIAVQCSRGQVVDIELTPVEP